MVDERGADSGGPLVPKDKSINPSRFETAIQAGTSDIRFALGAGFRSEENFLQALQTAEGLTDSLKGEAYMVIAGARILSGQNPKQELGIARTFIGQTEEELRGERTRRSGSDTLSRHLQELFQLKLRLASLYLRGGDITVGNELVRDLYESVLRYGYPMEIGQVYDARASQYDTWFHREKAKVDDLAAIGAFVAGNPAVNSVDIKTVAEQIGITISQEGFVKMGKGKEIFFNDYGSTLQMLATAQLYAGDLEAAQKTLKQLKEFEGELPERERQLISLPKINTLSLMASIESRVAKAVGVRNFSEEDVQSVLNSDDADAVMALGYLGVVNLQEWGESGKSLSDFAREQVLKGYERRLEVEEQRLNNQRKIIAVQREALQKRQG